MKNRPIIFVLLACLHFIEPVLKLFYFKFMTGFGWSVVINNILNIDSPKAIFEFWLLFPLAGAFLLIARKWCYPAFLAVQGYAIYAHFFYERFSWPYVAESPFMSSWLLLAFNLVVIGYFALPEVRTVFFNSGLRWWETPTRYYFELPCAVDFNRSDQLIDLKILNISSTGCFVHYPSEVMVGQPLTMHLTYGHIDVKLNAEVVRTDSFQGKEGFAMKYHFQNFWEVIKMRRLMVNIGRSEEFDFPATDLSNEKESKRSSSQSNKHNDRAA